MNEKRLLRVFAAGDAMVSNLEAEEAGARRYIGRRYDGEGPNGEGRWVPTGEVVEVPYRAEYVAALRAGELMPADDETAQLAGVKRDDGHTTTVERSATQTSGFPAARTGSE